MFDFEKYELNFRFREIMKKTWLIETKSEATPYGCDCYLLEGDSISIMIDSGMSCLNMKSYIEQLQLVHTPIAGVINTHSHFDHTGGNSWFQHAYMHEKAIKNAKKPFSSVTIEDYNLNYEVTFVKEGDAIDLGNRRLEIMEIGAHDTSSIAILDHGQRLLFSGDEIEVGWINVGSMSPVVEQQETIESHYDNMCKLAKRLHEFDYICPGHHGSPIVGEAIYDFVSCDEKILSGVPGEKVIPECVAGGGPYPAEVRVMRNKSAHICYRQDHIFKNERSGIQVEKK